MKKNYFLILIFTLFSNNLMAQVGLESFFTNQNYCYEDGEKSVLMSFKENNLVKISINDGNLKLFVSNWSVNSDMNKMSIIRKDDINANTLTLNEVKILFDANDFPILRVDSLNSYDELNFSVCD